MTSYIVISSIYFVILTHFVGYGLHVANITILSKSNCQWDVQISPSLNAKNDDHICMESISISPPVGTRCFPAPILAEYPAFWLTTTSAFNVVRLFVIGNENHVTQEIYAGFDLNLKSFGLVGNYLEWQEQVTNRCQLSQLLPMDCNEVVKSQFQLYYRDNLDNNNLLPAIQKIPSMINPFQFIHIDKSAGSTLRESIYNSAQDLGLVAIVPCHGHIHCVTLAINDLDSEDLKAFDIHKTTILAGHFPYEEWKNLPSYSMNRALIGTDGVTNDRPETAKASCLTIMRHPIDRAISYYYERCFMVDGCIGYQRTINSLTVEEFAAVVQTSRRGEYRKNSSQLMIVDEGIPNAASRLLANKRGTSGLKLGMNIATLDDFDDKSAELAIRNMQQCVVGLFEELPDTLKVIRHWFPWINHLDIANRIRLYEFTNIETRDVLRPELYAILENANLFDLKLYEHAYWQFHDELYVLGEDVVFGQSRTNLTCS